ncbi:hypothetical protein D5F01_LYC22987 [Larimichthys crocea]|uniref:Endonuclease domain-containing 1 protein n=1 Tax=Larimichthys crocea TaxID=215358 RepID=A0A6G0HJH7_LARCR|nr:hypothetical protein D5F01_LYC22987 [Larimichthys crocea]
MTSLKTKNICFLAAFLFLAIVPTLAKVVNEVEGCDQFLHDETPPEIPGILEDGANKAQNRYKIICQTYGDDPDPKSNQRFLTVYDIVNRVPLFSAYEYKGSGGKRKDNWMIEPQLESGINLGDNMMKEDSNINYNNQAIENDYEGNGVYDKGHLFPVNHASDQEQLDSTFTLTNVVPQHYNFNRGRWETMESDIKTKMDEQKVKDNKIRCFVVVGAQPSDNNNLNDNNNKPKNKPKNKPNNKPKKEVNIPKMMWSAFYCTNTVSGAYWDDNADHGKGATMKSGTVQELQDELGKTLQGFTVFPQKQPALKRSSSDSQQPQAGSSKQPRKSRSPSSSAGRS